MSLDVYLRGEPYEEDCRCPHCDNEHKKQEREEFFQWNITHNLGKMAREAGLYDACWRPDEIGITKASWLIEPLEKGLDLLKKNPARFTPFNPSNGWGNYDGLVEFVERYLKACRDHPDANVSVSR